MPTHRGVSTAAAIACAGLVAVAAGRAQDDVPHRQFRRVMGSLAEVQVYHADRELAARAMGAALDEMQRVDALLSNYRPDSELSRMNAAASKAPFHASPELYAFVARSRAYFEQTLGTFDPTMGPVVRAWGFFTPRAARPGSDEAAVAKARSGFDKVRLDDATRSVSYAAEGMELDPGGIGKGYAVDRAVAVLRDFGISTALVNAGGSTLYALGWPPGKEGWKLAVRDPARPAASIRYVTLRDQALSTSGIGERYVEIDSVRYGHIIDPRSGEPAAGTCQVTLIAPTATDSDALTKAAFLLAREQLVKLFGERRVVHVLRIEGACAAGGGLWATPWSEGVFYEGGRGPAARE